MLSHISAFAQRFRKQILIAFDVVVVTVSYMLPWALITGRTSFSEYSSLLISSCFFFVCCYEIVYGLMGMYDSLWRYAEIVEFFRLCVASAVAVSIFVVVTLLLWWEERGVPRSVYALSALFASSLTLYSRLTYRMYRNTTLKKRARANRRTLLIGAGDAALAGFIIAHDYKYDPKRSLQFAAAFGTASCLVEGTNPPRRISVAMVNNQVSVYEI